MARGKADSRFWSKVRPHSNLADAHWRLGGFYQKQGKYELAIDEFSKALNVDETLCKAYNGIAMSYDAVKRCDLAHKAYELALECDPGKAYVYNNYGYSSILCNQSDKGTALLLKAEELSGGKSQIKNNLKLARLAATRQLAPETVLSPTESHKIDLATMTSRELTTYTASAAQEKNAKVEAERAVKLDQIVEEVPPPTTNPQSVALVPTVGANFQPHLLIDDIDAPEAGEDKTRVDISVTEVRREHVPESATEPVKQLIDTAVEKRSPEPEGEQANTASASTSGKNHKILLSVPEYHGQPVESPEVQAKKPQEGEVEEKTQALYQKPETGVEVSNGNGVTGMARRSSKLLGGYGFKVRRITNAKHFHFSDSVIYYRRGYYGVAEELADFIPGEQKLEQVESLGRATIGVRVLLGSDLVMLDFPQHYEQLSYVQLEQGQPGVWKELVQLTMDE